MIGMTPTTLAHRSERGKPPAFVETNGQRWYRVADLEPFAEAYAIVQGSR